MPPKQRSLILSLSLALSLCACTCVTNQPRPTAQDGEGPAPTAPSSSETPTSEGTIRQLLAIGNDRAVVVFVPYTQAGIPSPTMALMHRDGRIGWSVSFDHSPLAGRTSTGIEIVGDAISVAIARDGEPPLGHERLDRIEIYGLADGRRRAIIRPEGEYYGRETIVDRDERYDALIHTDGTSNLIIASDARGERWRATMEEIPGHEIIALPEVVAVHEGGGGGLMATGQGSWRVFSRRDGRVVANVRGSESTCCDGQRWFVLARGDVLKVDTSDFSTDLVMDDPMLPGIENLTFLRDCTIIDGRPIAFVQRGMTEGLVAVSADDGTVERAVSLGIRRYREGAVYPLPDRLHPVVATISENGDSMVELGVVDLERAGPTLERSSTPLRTWLGAQALPRFDNGEDGGYMVAARGLIAIIDGDDGELRGRYIRRDTMAMHRTQLVGTLLWLPPPAPTRLGRGTPTVIDLSQRSDDAEVSDEAVSAALHPPREITCDTLSRAGYDGLGVSDGLGPVSPSRLPPWDPQHLAEGARRFACASESAVVVPLAWSIIEDDRPLRNHNVLALVEDRVDGVPLYTAVSMYRHATNTAWNMSVSFHDPSRPIRRFASRPTTADLDAFIDQSHFEFVESWGRVLVGNLIDSNWVAATGEAPTRHFAAGIEQAD
jgi:hypothetical protein